MMGNNMNKTQFFHRTEINNHDNIEITGKKNNKNKTSNIPKKTFTKW